MLFSAYAQEISSPYSSTMLNRQTDHYTVLNAKNYRRTILNARADIEDQLRHLKIYRSSDINAKIIYITQHLADIPYLYRGANGEGDWQPDSPVYKPGAVHINQYPVYRLDGFNCQTFVQVVLALLHAHSLDEFDTNIIHVAYGATRERSSTQIHFYNRLHFIDGDWNPALHRLGWSRDSMLENHFAHYTKSLSITLSRQNFFLSRMKHLKDQVAVLDPHNGPVMVQHFLDDYANLPFPDFKSESIRMIYLPKAIFATQRADGQYAPTPVMDLIPAPAIVEMINDPQKWYVHGQGIKALLGTALTVSHFGLLYRQTFHDGELIYHRINCEFDYRQQKQCHVTPIYCQQNNCHELMLTHATDAYPNGYYWYQENNGQYTCTASQPSSGTPYTYCNRVEHIPLFNYLTNQQYGGFSLMHYPTLLGLHIEQLR